MNIFTGEAIQPINERHRDKDKVQKGAPML